MSTINERRRPPLAPLPGANISFSKDSNRSISGDINNKSAFSATSSEQAPSQSSSSFDMDSDQENAVEVGDAVDVPGGMVGVVKFIGTVKGKPGVFAGVELTKTYAARGKNSGDVDGTRYFTTSIPGSGIFLPLQRAAKRSSPTLSASKFPPTPTTPSLSSLDFNKPNRSASRTPPTPSVPKFSQSLGPAARHPFSQSVGPGVPGQSPQLKKPRQSLPRPESPLRKAPAAQPIPPKSGGKVLRTPSNASPAFSKPTANKTSTPGYPRSQSRSESRSQSRQTDVSPEADNTPTPLARTSHGPVATFGSMQSSRDDEIQRLYQQLEERDRQLKEQALSLAEMETSVAELQSAVATSSSSRSFPAAEDAATDGADASQLRSLLREKNERIATITAEFDSHRADFRSTIDTLEMASTETERVYEKRVQELLQEVDDLRRALEERDRQLEEYQTGNTDVEIIARELKDMEDQVADLEQETENARRAEADARGEVDHLRRELEHMRAELKNEREKAAKALKDAGEAMDTGASNGMRRKSTAREVQQRDDEIRGLKAIIHSLNSSSAVPWNGTDSGISDNSINDDERQELSRLRESVASFHREKNELQGMLERKQIREEDLERENTRLRENGATGIGSAAERAYTPSQSLPQIPHSGISPDKTPKASNNRNSNASTATTVRPGSYGHSRTDSRFRFQPTTSPTAEKPLTNTNISEATEGSVSTADTDTLWCEICETTGHDILTCKEIGGGDGPADTREEGMRPLSNRDSAMPNGLKIGQRRTSSQSQAEDSQHDSATTPTPTPDAVDEQASALAMSMPGALPPEDGPAPGKNSGTINMSLWCAMCERDGHGSTDCPFEDF